MQVRLRVVNEENEEGAPSDYLFDEERVTIGRGEKNDLTLADPKRVVSSEHAVVTREGTTYQLIDRGSKNFTYVGNQRITAEEPYELSDGDTFRIGDFRLEFAVIEMNAPASSHQGETVFDHDFANPFEDPVRQVQEALADLVEAYEREAPQRRDEALKEALQNAPDELSNHTAVRPVLDMLAGAQHDGSAHAAVNTRSSSVPEPSSRKPDSSRSPSPRSDEERQAPDQRVRAPNPVADVVVDTLSEALAEVLPIPWRFRHEFIGQTIMQAPKTQFLHQGNGEVIKNHLMDPTISKEKREERLDLVMDAAESVGVHQVAMLNGYKASVMNGSEALLELLDPDAHEEEVRDQNVVFDYVPMLASPATLERLRAEWEELRRGDSAVAEQRIFRPAFTKAYLARMTAPPTAVSDGDEGSGMQG